MKKIINLFAAGIVIAAFAASCDKVVPEASAPEVQDIFEYSFSSTEEALSKTTLDGLNIKWENADAIGLYTGTQQNVKGLVNGSSFSATLSEELNASDIIYFYFPYSNANASASVSSVTMSIPAAQSVSAGGEYDADAMPQRGTATVTDPSSTIPATFRNLASIVEFYIYSSDATGAGSSIASVEFEAESAIAGDFSYDITSADAPISGYTATAVTTTLANTPAIGNSTSNAAKAPMVIAPGTYKGVVRVTTTGSDVFEYDIVNEFSIERNKKKKVAVDLTMSKSNPVEGTGVDGDPFIVHSQAQLKEKLSGSNHVKLGANILMDNTWTPVNFAGVFDGDGKTIAGLSQSFINALSGTVKNVRFTDVAIGNYKSSDNCKGVVSQTAQNATITGVVAYGTMSSSTTNGTNDYSGLGGITGRASGVTVISNCYIDVDISIVGSNYSTGGILGIIRETNNITISRCTFAGSISGSGNYTKIGGILGRKTYTNQNSNDIIEDCLVSGDITVTGTGSNMLGGAFGALQGADINGDYVGGLTIVRTAFTGSISAGAAVGGIAGVGPSVTDCFISGNIQATTTGSNGGSAGVVAAAKGNVNRCVVTGSRITGNNQDNFSTAGVVCRQNGNAPNVSNCAVINASIQDNGKAVLGATANLTASSNKWFGVEYINNGAYVSGGTVQDGEAFAAAPTQADFEALGYDFTDVWKWNAAGYPELKNAGASVK